jgi:hypothetical protein
MENEILAITAYFGSWLCIAGLIWTLFDRIEKVATESAKESAVQFTLNYKRSEKIESLGIFLGNSFDCVFGGKHLTWSCFLRSSVASFLCMFIVAAIWVSIRPREASLLYKENGALNPLIFLMFYGLLLNIIPDYLSLLQTRIIIRHLKLKKWSALFWVIFDFGLTVIIASLLWLFLFYYDTGHLITYSEFSDGILSLSNFMNRDLPPLGVVFYSTFFTSIWMWIYAASIGLVKSTVYIDKFHFFAIKNLFRKEQPFMSLGAISITIVTLIYLLAFPVYLIIT